jgi:AraC family transcriptional regulator of adaptative response/methylated-DNA-[protein]-cysteine methyltransferase
MEDSKQYYFTIVAKAIEYIEVNFKEQPDLNDIAAHVNISPYHFQKIFTEWVGVSPKKYLQFLNVSYAKSVIKHHNISDTAYNTGLSGSGRLHDLFINIEGMTPGEYKNGGRKLTINYHFAESCFGRILVSSTSKGVCHISFSDDEQKALDELTGMFPNATIRAKEELLHEPVINFFNADWDEPQQIKLHLKGTAFQLKVWDALLKIPVGKLATYGDIAQSIDKPSAQRAVGTAIGSNPVAYLIPCHRVIRASGAIGGYRWGHVRKKAMIAWEASKSE